jgi:hypothetical protein
MLARLSNAEVTLSPIDGVPTDDDDWYAFAHLVDLGSRVELVRARFGQTLDVVATVDGITHTITLDQWTLTLRCSPGDPDPGLQPLGRGAVGFVALGNRRHRCRSSSSPPPNRSSTPPGGPSSPTPSTCASPAAHAPAAHRAGGRCTSNALEATADLIVAAPAVVYDGVNPVLIEFFCPGVSPPTTLLATLSLWIFQDGTSIGRAAVTTPAASALYAPVHMVRRLTPTAASHTYAIHGTSSTGTAGTVNAGPGGTGAQWIPSFIRIVGAT